MLTYDWRVMRTWIRIIMPDPQFKLIDSDSDPGPNLLGTVPVTDMQPPMRNF
jgi:hypothetical protein